MCFVLNFFAVHHLRPTLHKLDLCHLSRKPKSFTTLLVSWDFVESYFQCWYPSSTIPSSAQRQVKFSHWMIPAYTSTKDIPSFHLCQALFTKIGRSARLMSLVFLPLIAVLFSFILHEVQTSVGRVLAFECISWYWSWIFWKKIHTSLV
jgi:hypothetical protein